MRPNRTPASWKSNWRAMCCGRTIRRGRGDGFIAAGLGFVGRTELEGTTDKAITRLLDRDDMVMTTMSTFVSMTAHCARCHDHKFDPIKQEDYYSLQAVFAGVDRADRPYDADPKVYAARRPLLERRRALTIELRPLQESAANVTSPALKKLDEQLSALKLEFADSKKAELQPQIAKLTAERKTMVQDLLSADIGADPTLTADLQSLDRELASLGKPQLVYTAANFFRSAGHVPIRRRAAPDYGIAARRRQSPGAPAAGRALLRPSLPAGSRSRPAKRRSPARRAGALDHRPRQHADLAIDRQPRLAVSLRRRHVDSANDFGHMGTLPTHPELLDWLAVTFRDQGGRMKQLHN